MRCIVLNSRRKMLYRLMKLVRPHYFRFFEIGVESKVALCSRLGEEIKILFTKLDRKLMNTVSSQNLFVFLGFGQGERYNPFEFSPPSLQTIQPKIV